MGSFRYTLNLITAFADIKFKWLGRKLVHSIAEGFIMLALLFFIIVYMAGKQHELRFVASLAVLSVMGQTTLLFCTNNVLSNELFPTGIRNLSFSWGQVLSRIGVVLAPQLFILVSLLQIIIFIKINSLNFRVTFGHHFLIMFSLALPLLTSFSSISTLMKQKVFQWPVQCQEKKNHGPIKDVWQKAKTRMNLPNCCPSPMLKAMLLRTRFFDSLFVFN